MFHRFCSWMGIFTFFNISGDSLKAGIRFEFRIFQDSQDFVVDYLKTI